ncbi:hypothetical protein UFOVP324_29 [uncultured Caudovirales phage]|jgi:hypothetical protein|uniref:DUF7936 domain-containing protein n=1 Tax=uncultured Caudovirales phage TaxID=2100421 RepID=A0A6J5M002_9CAUD|nr:hypothetical protein UFOVP324_29 [uncultured Caudovirales phage]
MELNFKWIIVQLDTKPQEGDLLDVVSVVHWRRNASDKMFIAESYGSMSCPTPSETDFTAYPDLTQEQVESWLEAGLDVSAIDNSLIMDIENQINPPIVTLPLPWIKEA